MDIQCLNVWVLFSQYLANFAIHFRSNQMLIGFQFNCIGDFKFYICDCFCAFDCIVSHFQFNRMSFPFITIVCLPFESVFSYTFFVLFYFRNASQFIVEINLKMVTWCRRQFVHLNLFSKLVAICVFDSNFYCYCYQISWNETIINKSRHKVNERKI